MGTVVKVDLKDSKLIVKTEDGEKTDERSPKTNRNRPPVGGLRSRWATTALGRSSLNLLDAPPAPPVASHASSDPSAAVWYGSALRLLHARPAAPVAANADSISGLWQEPTNARRCARS
jgi:hypothetical protein